MNVKFFHVNNRKLQNSVTLPKRYNSLNVGILAAALSGCAAAVPEDMPPWQIVIASPSFYSVNVSGAYGVNDQEDWTALTHGFSQLSRRNEFKNARKWMPEYDGFGIPLNPLVNVAGRQIGSGTNSLPDSIYVYWTSYIGQTKFYATRYDVPDTIKQFMRTKRSYIRRDGVKQPCYQSDFVFGLLPNGHAKVWLEGCAIYTYITELSPAKELEKDFYGFGIERYGNRGDISLKKQAQIAGRTIEPIPWDKVNKVYWNPKTDQVDSIEDYLPGAGK